MIRVLHIVHTMNCGGIETMLMNVYRNINRDKITFDFLVNGSKDNYYTEEIISLGGNVLSVTPKRKNFIKNIIETYKIIKSGNYDVVHIHQDSMIGFGLWCAKKAKVKNIFTHAHTTSADGWYRRLITKLNRKYIRKNADVKFACSSAAAKWIYGKNCNDYVLFNNSIDASKYEYNKEKSVNRRKKLNIPKDCIVIGTCGRLAEVKNQKFLLQIFCELKKKKDNSKCILIGDGELRNELLDYAKKHNISKDLIITGMVNNPEDYYSLLDCFILPSFYEGLPLSGIEAQAAGIPTIFSNGVSKEVDITGESLFLSIEESPEKWMNEILNIIGKKKNNYEIVVKKGYDMKGNVKLLENYYLERKG